CADVAAAGDRGEIIDRVDCLVHLERLESAEANGRGTDATAGESKARQIARLWSRSQSLAVRRIVAAEAYVIRSLRTIAGIEKLGNLGRFARALGSVTRKRARFADRTAIEPVSTLPNRRAPLVDRFALDRHDLIKVSENRTRVRFRQTGCF